MSSQLPLSIAATLLLTAVPCHSEPARTGVRPVGVVSTREAGHIATRLLVARSAKLKKLAWLEAETTYEPGRGMRYRVVREGGDAGIRRRVLRKVLDNEVEISGPAAAAQAAITDANYVMNAGESGTVRLTPRRREPVLIDGVATLDAHGQLRRIEGRLSKSPSFWVRSVQLTRSYELVEGRSLPVHVESVADVKFAGDCEFSMWIDYTSVDGQPVRRVVARREPPTSVAAPLLIALQQTQ